MRSSTEMLVGVLALLIRWNMAEKKRFPIIAFNRMPERYLATIYLSRIS